MSSRGDYGSGTPGAIPYSNTVGGNLAQGASTVTGVPAAAAQLTPIIIVSSTAPNNADGMPNGTVYIQTT